MVQPYKCYYEHKGTYGYFIVLARSKESARRRAYKSLRLLNGNNPISPIYRVHKVHRFLWLHNFKALFSKHKPTKEIPIFERLIAGVPADFKWTTKGHARTFLRAHYDFEREVLTVLFSDMDIEKYKGTSYGLWYHWPQMSTVSSHSGYLHKLNEMYDFINEHGNFWPTSLKQNEL